MRRSWSVKAYPSIQQLKLEEENLYCCFITRKQGEMNIEAIREYALSFPQVEESLPFGPGNLVFKVKGKMFLLLALDANPLQFNVKCDPEKAIGLREHYPGILPGYHMNKKHWNTVLADGRLTAHQLKSFIAHSYDLVLAAKK